MKKINGLILLSIILSATSFAQWRVIYPNEKYNYLISSQNDSIIRTTIWVDSAKIENGDSVYYLNRVFVKKGIVNGPWTQHEIFQINQSQFLKSKITVDANNVQHIEGDVNWYVNGHCNTGDSWIFDSTTNKTAYCDSIFEMNFFGITDSVKRIEIGLLDTILLSKFNGIISFPDFDTISRKYNLAGVEIQHMGLTVPKAYDFSNFNVGDEFEYKSGSSFTFYASGPHTSYSFAFIRYIILSKSLATDSVMYQVNRKSRIENHPLVGSVTLQVDTNIIDTVIYKLNNAGNFLNEKYNMEYVYQPGLIYWSVFEKDTIGSGYRKHYYGSTCSVYGQDSILIGKTNPVDYSQKSHDDYSQIFGLISSGSSSGSGGPLSGSSQSSYKNLLACTINGIQYGQYQPDNTYHDCSLDSINNNVILSDKDTLIDADTTAILHSSVQATSYLWSTGATNDILLVHTKGTYTLKVTNDYGCTRVSTKQIFAYRNVDGNSIVASALHLCNNNNAILSSELSGFNYLWSTGSTASSITVNTPGTYYLTTTDSYGLSSVKSVTITNTITTPFNWPGDTVINYHGTITLKIPWVYDTYLWNDSDTWFTKTFNEANLNPGVNKIWAMAYKSNCIESDTIILLRSPDESVSENNFTYFFSIANGEMNFTPTTYDCSYELYSIEGKLIFEESNSNGASVKSHFIKSLNSGIYFLRIATSKKTYTGKIFVRHQ